ncbi:hypothetical protein ACSBR2_039513 [Camellia fascicularis]
MFVGSRREDDWTCPSCGNVKFSFRTTCNMCNCTQSRPTDHNSKSIAIPIQPMHGYSSSAPYVGFGAPSSMGSAYPYNYGSYLSGGSPYRPLYIAGSTPYSSGSMMGNEKPAPLYPSTHIREKRGPRPGFLPDDKYQKKDGTRDNDWTCRKCGNVNFSFRTVSNMRKCNTPKPKPQATKSDSNSRDGSDRIQMLHWFTSLRLSGDTYNKSSRKVPKSGWFLHEDPPTVKLV